LCRFFQNAVKSRFAALAAVHRLPIWKAAEEKQLRSLGVSEDTTPPEVKTVEDFLDSIENQQLYQVLTSNIKAIPTDHRVRGQILLPCFPLCGEDGTAP